MCDSAKQEMVERILNRGLSKARYRLIKRVVQMSEAELVILAGLIHPRPQEEGPKTGLEAASEDDDENVTIERFVGTGKAV